MIKVKCENCGANLQAPDASAGKRLSCTKCMSPVQVPEQIDEVLPVPVVQVAKKKREAIRRESSRDDYDERERRPVSWTGSVFGIIGLVACAVGFPFAIVPCTAVFALPVVGFGFAFSAIGMVIALLRGESGIGFPIAGFFLGLIGGGAAILWIAVPFSALPK